TTSYANSGSPSLSALSPSVIKTSGLSDQASGSCARHNPCNNARLWLTGSRSNRSTFASSRSGVPEGFASESANVTASAPMSFSYQVEPATHGRIAFPNRSSAHGDFGSDEPHAADVDVAMFLRESKLQV